MTAPATDSRDLVAMLTRAAGATGEAILADVEFQEYDWHVPRHFSANELAGIAELADTLADRLAEALTGYLRRPITLAAAKVAEAYRDRLTSTEARPFVAPLTVGKTPAGALVLDADRSVAWISALLGADVSQRGDAGLSDLETDLLDDLASALSSAAAEVLSAADAPGFGRDGPVVPGLGALPGEAETAYCELRFAVAEAAEDGADEDAGGDPEAVRLLLTCRALDPLGRAGGAAEEARADPAADEQAMRAHLGSARVTAEVRVGGTELSVREVMGLEPGDVLPLDRLADEPLDAFVQHTRVLAGRAVATHDGRYGIQVTATPGRGSEEPDPAAAENDRKGT